MINAMVYAGLPDVQKRIVRMQVSKGLPSEIINAVCDEYSINKKLLASRSKISPLPEARQIACYLLRELCGMTLKSIGEVISRDHSTVIYCLNTCDGLMKFNKKFRERMQSVKNRLS